ncbi:lipopolysaccharide biosynthesis protein [Prevotella sp. E9-3]|uniref:lipopolysaccharide biosynthesis protein n=1 Tax=Prevotella sp. E9-3 TaxID=2913621 RepID=UPI001EDB2339|nr:lipopolysaccharide biosynthesis protein [Prevotella sp. E9-3]UKK49477.1 lipopolysaccharide biosynthesis protein [Prevotella sp. E9-3]
MAKNLKQKAASGMIWTALQKYSTMFIQFISGIILARLLTPYDYGCIGMLMIFMVLAEAFIDGGFGSALIQKKRPTQEDYSTIFWWNLGMAVLMYAILYVSAPAIARFYDIPLLCDVLRVQGLVLFIYAFNIIQRNQLRKKLNFRVLSIVTITTSITSLLITILMAYHGYGVWALVAQHLLTAFIPALVFWFYIRWRPIWTFSWQSFRELFSFGFYMFLTHLLNQFGQQLQGLLIGKMYNPAIMGYYSKAQGTEKLASTSISQVLTQVTYPLYAEVQDDKEKLGNMIKRLTMTLAYITFPLMFLLLLCAKPIFLFLYSERWLPSVPYFQVLCIAGLAYCLQSVNLQSIAAIGKSKMMFVWTVIKRTIGIGFVVGGLALFGINGLLIGMVLNTWFSYFVNISLVSKHVGYKWWKQLMDIVPIMVSAVVAAAVSYETAELCHFSIYLDGLVKLFIYIIAYAGWSLLFKPEAFIYTKSIVTPMFSKIKKKFSRR